MHTRKITAQLFVLASVVVGLFVAPVSADTWPSRTITFVIPFPAGGSNDGIGRIIAKELADKLGQNVVVDNRGGATGNIGAAAVARAAPDGYTLLIASTGPAAVNKLLNKSLSYDPRKDFTPIIVLGIVPQVIIVSSKLPVNNLQELVEFARKNPGKVNFGNSGYGTMAHIAAISLAQATGIDVTHVNYKGSAPLITDVKGGHIGVGFPGFIPPLMEMKALAVTGAKRMDLLPKVPTVKETGIADIVAGTWFALLMPAGVPKDVVLRVNKIVNDFLETDQAKELMKKLGMTVIGGTPEEAVAFINAESDRWGKVIEAAGMAKAN